VSRVRQLIDAQGRVLGGLRVSLTDRCNLRCLYCLPESEAAQDFYRGHWAKMPNAAPLPQPRAPKAQLLSFEEIERVVRLAVQWGIRSVRLTGGEPLLRQEVEKLVARLAAIPEITALAMTSNGFLFPQKALPLRAAGLRRITFSLDSLDPDNFKRVTGCDNLRDVLRSIRLARDLGFHPVKVNAVIIRGLNDHEIEPLAQFARDQDLCCRFIEFMPLDSARAWLKEMVVPGREVLARLQGRFQLHALPSEDPSATAKRWAFADGRGEVGLITPVTQPFCGHCNHIRLTADGKIRTCLFSVAEHDLGSRLRSGASDDEIAEWLQGVVWQKEPRHHIGEPEFVPPSRTMSCIGG